MHPLYLCVGVLSALTGQLLLFLSATLAALEHECAHALAARRAGFVLDKIVLMPYGAVVSGEIGGISPKEEILVCLAGPLANALTALAFAALWWLYPETYPYTDLAAYVSLSLFLVNLLPARPLDGGRILGIVLRPLGARRAELICRVTTWTVAAAVAGYFVFSCFSRPNFGALIFSGASPTMMPMEVEASLCVSVSARLTAGEAMRFLREDKYLVLVLFEDGEFCGEVTEGELLSMLERGEYARPLGETLPAL